MFTYDDNLFSDYHKEAYGFRPSPETYAEWRSASPERKQAIWNTLCEAAEHRAIEEKLEQERAIAAHEATIKEYMRMFNLSVEDAIRWDVESYNIGDYGTDYYYYLKGLPYWYKTPNFTMEEV